MIGRTNELGQLQRTLHAVHQDGHRRIALITGEAGLGKSRLITEFRRGLAHSDVKIYQGGGLTYARSAPLGVIAALLRDIVQIPHTVECHTQQEILQAYLTQHNLPANEISPYLMHVLGVEQTDPHIEARLQLLDAVMLQRQTHAALRQVFLTEAGQGVTVLILEDLHRIDPASKDFLDYLLHTTDEAQLLLVLVSREVEQAGGVRTLLAEAKSDGALVDIQLQPLSGVETHSLINQLITQTCPDAWALKENVVKRAEGNPFFVEEIVRMLIDQGGLARKPTAGAWQVTSKANELLKAVPGNVQGLILARFDRLPEGLRRILQIAAVLGPSFPIKLLQILSDTAIETLTGQLNELEARRFLLAESALSEPSFSFWHTLLQEVLYGTLLKRDRSKIHTRVAEAIEHGTLWLAEERIEVLAYHYAESTKPVKAIPYLITAAEKCGPPMRL